MAASALALAWRAVLLAAPPLLSDDVYRYVWEGRIQGHGGNPYAWEDRPEAARWTPMRDDGLGGGDPQGLRRRSTRPRGSWRRAR